MLMAADLGMVPFKKSLKKEVKKVSVKCSYSIGVFEK